MPYTLTMPKLSPTMEEGSIVKWHKKEGEFVKAGELLIEVSTDKATVEFNALDDGFIKKILVGEGKEAIVNQPIAIMTEEKEESIEGYLPEGELKKNQESVKTVEVTTAPIQEPLPKKVETVPSPAKRLVASPLAKKIAKEKGIDLSLIAGTGTSGRIMSRDLEGAGASKKRVQSKFAEGAFTEEPLTAVKKVIAKRLQEAKSSIPHFYVTTVVDASPLVALKDQLTTLQNKVSINDCVVKAVALALQDHPEVNSGYNTQNQSLVRFQTIDLSIAVGAEEGLITPIVRYADQKSLFEISSEVKALSEKARSGRLQPNEFVGGSFTISNLGMYGVSSFQSIINPPQGAILSVSAVLDVPVVKDGLIVPGKTMSLTLSADHRVMDGVAVAVFLKTLKAYLENPVALLL